MNRFSPLFLPVVAFFATVLLGLILVFDREVGAALLMLVVLTVATMFLLRRLGVSQREVYVLLALVVIFHAAFTLFVHYSGFQPFGTGGGDFIRYNITAQEVANRVTSGNFSLKGTEVSGLTYFPAIIGYVYALVLPAVVVGQMFVVWIAAMSILTLYFLTLQIGATRTWAFLVALLGSFYPSFVFFTSYVLKDGLVLLLALLSLLVLIKLLDKFSWRRYALFFLLAIPLTNLRAEIYDVFVIVFFVCWFLLAKMDIKRRVILGIVLFALYGFAPVIALFGTHNSYLDYGSFKNQLNVKKAVDLKERSYVVFVKPDVSVKTNETDAAEELSPKELDIGFRSTVLDLKATASNPISFVWNQMRAFAFVSIGPFPWQFAETRHQATLVETIPWLFLVPFILRGIWRKFKEDKRAPALTLALFSFGMFLMIALFINNFGITMRIRMPGVLALLPFLPFAVFLGHPPLLDRLVKRSYATLKRHGVQKSFYMFLRLVFVRLSFFPRYELRKLFWGLAVKNINGYKMFLDLKKDVGISKDLFIFGKREHISTDFLLDSSIIQKGDCVLDIGANIGYYAFLESGLVGKEGLVYALEPVSENLEALNKNIELNDIKNIKTYNLAAGSFAGKQPIHLNKKSNWASMIYRPDQGFIGEREVDVVTVDDFVDREVKRIPRLIRMDVEGYEYAILQGMKKTMKQGTTLFIEFHLDILTVEQKQSIRSLLEESGYNKAVIIKDSGPLSRYTPKGDIRPLIRFLDHKIEEEGSVHNGIQHTNLDECMNLLVNEQGDLHAFHAFILRVK